MLFNHFTKLQPVPFCAQFLRMLHQKNRIYVPIGLSPKTQIWVFNLILAARKRGNCWIMLIKKLEEESKFWFFLGMRDREMEWNKYIEQHAMQRAAMVKHIKRDNLIYGYHLNFCHECGLKA